MDLYRLSVDLITFELVMDPVLEKKGEEVGAALLLGEREWLGEEADDVCDAAALPLSVEPLALALELVSRPNPNRERIPNDRDEVDEEATLLAFVVEVACEAATAAAAAAATADDAEANTDGCVTGTMLVSLTS